MEPPLSAMLNQGLSAPSCPGPPLAVLPILQFLPQAVDPAYLGRSLNFWRNASPPLLKGTGAVRAQASRPNTAGSACYPP